jgi:hypothetical protein
MESLSMQDNHLTPDMPSRGMRIALGIINRISVALHMGTKDWYEDHSSEGVECI